MQIIISHVNTDFDALASMIAAKKLYPEAQLVISDKLENRVQRFLNIYRDMFDFIPNAHVDWEQVTEMIIVDVASLSRIGKLPNDFNPSTRNIIVFDHHPPGEKDVSYDEGIVEQTGAAVTILLEKIQERGLQISKFEASLFGLGIYTDTGNFTYNNTTTRDLQAAVFLLSHGMNMEMVQRFSEQTLTSEQQDMLDHLLANTAIHEIDGLEIAVSTYELPTFHNGLAMVTNKLLNVKGTDAAIAIVKMKTTVCIVGRANSERITLQPILKKLGGGGHKHAGSATVKKGDEQAIYEDVMSSLHDMLQPAITAADLMTSPVKTITPDTTIEEAGRLMYRYGHSGYPITEDGRLVGLITRRDLDKANHHGLGHAPVKAYMTTKVYTIEPGTTLEEIQELVIEHNIGRLPVIVDGKIAGIVTRTNIIQALHQEILTETLSETASEGIARKMDEQLPKEVCRLLKDIGETASSLDMPVYLIGGIVRDILLERPNQDIDIVAEGDGIALAKELQETFGGEVQAYESFGTATWYHPAGHSIDLISSRLEYYERPAALPEVEKSILVDDLLRRDFTINAMAIRLNPEAFGELIDPFGGQHDLKEKHITILHNISFVEDPTRIFRAVRFEERFGFSMDEQTEKLALESADKMKQLTPHRIDEELKRLFNECRPEQVIGRLFDLDVWQQFGIDSAHKEASFAAAVKLSVLQGRVAHSTPGWFEYFLIPFCCSGKLDAARPFALMKKEQKLLEEINELLEDLEWLEAEHPGKLHLRLHDRSDEAILFITATGNVHSHMVVGYVQKRRNLTKWLSGADLKSAGLKPGPAFSELLLEFEASQLNGDVTSKEEVDQWLENYLYTH